MEQSSALLMGYYGARNAGDDLMLEYISGWLHRQGFRVDVLGEQERALELCRPDSTFTKNTPLAGEWGFPGVWLRGEATQVVRAIQRTDHLVIGGGDLFRDDRGWRTFLYTFEKILLANLVGTPVHLVNVGIGAPGTRYGKRLYDTFLPRCRTLLVRDQRSIEICHSAGARHAQLLPDAVLAMEAGETSVELPERPYMVVALRFLFLEGRNVGLSQAQLENVAGALDRVVVEQDMDVLFVPFQDLEGWKDDVLHRGVQDLMVEKARCRHQPWTGDFSSLVALFSGAELVLAMPLHASIIALFAGAKTLMISYDHKCRELAGSMRGGEVADLDVLESRPELEIALEKAFSGEGLSGLAAARDLWTEARLEV